MTNPIALIRALFERYDQLTLGENCSQLEHAVACAMLAQQQGRGIPCRVRPFCTILAILSPLSGNYLA